MTIKGLFSRVFRSKQDSVSDIVLVYDNEDMLEESEQVKIGRYVEGLSSSELLNLAANLLSDSIITLRSFERVYHWKDKEIRDIYLYKITHAVHNIPESMILDFDSEENIEFINTVFVGRICGGLEVLLELKKFHNMGLMSSCSEFTDYFYDTTSDE